jgi:hypothetical protein
LRIQRLTFVMKSKSVALILILWIEPKSVTLAFKR